MTRFDTDTAVVRVSESAFDARIDRGWWIINGPNGGYVAAIVLRALEAAVADDSRPPRSLSLHYLRPPREGSVRVEVTIERQGRTLTTASARMMQQGRPVVVALAAFACERRGVELCTITPPAFPPPELCPTPARTLGSSGPTLHQRYEARWAVGELFSPTATEAVCGGWIRLAEPRRADAALVAALTDAFPPAIMMRRPEPGLMGGVPTIDLTIHFRQTLPLTAASADDFCAVVFRSRLATHGYVEEDGEVWSRGGVLLAQSRQLALVAAPEPQPTG